LNELGSHLEYKIEVIIQLDNSKIVYAISEHIDMDWG